MTQEQVGLLTRSFEKVLLNGDTVAALFYECLFEFDPRLRPMFRNDMRGQGQKFIMMLQHLVALLGQPEQLVAVVHERARSHDAYGVRAEHYLTVHDALLWALHQNRTWAQTSRPTSSTPG